MKPRPLPERRSLAPVEKTTVLLGWRFLEKRTSDALRERWGAML